MIGFVTITKYSGFCVFIHLSEFLLQWQLDFQNPDYLLEFFFFRERGSFCFFYIFLLGVCGEICKNVLNHPKCLSFERLCLFVVVVLVGCDARNGFVQLYFLNEEESEDNIFDGPLSVLLLERRI